MVEEEMQWYLNLLNECKGLGNGIICVNDPPKKLIKAIQNDNRIRLFEYKVSYTEVK